MPTSIHRSRWLHWALLLLGCGALGAVFALYGEPQFMLTLAQQVWACF